MIMYVLLVLVYAAVVMSLTVSIGALIGAYDIGFVLAWYDGWIGYYWDRESRRLYVLPLPFIGVKLEFQRRHPLLEREVMSGGFVEQVTYVPSIPCNCGHEIGNHGHPDGIFPGCDVMGCKCMRYTPDPNYQDPLGAPLEEFRK